MRIVPATRASSLLMVIVTATGFAGGGGWGVGRAPAPAAVDKDATPSPAVETHAGHVRADPAAATAAVPSHEHHAQHAPQSSAIPAGSTAKHHSHDCEKGICRCDSRCPPRRPCGGAMRSCSGDGQDAGLGPGPLRPFLLSAVAVLAPAFDRLARPDAASTPLTRALDVVSPPPRPSSI
jgi:hypothetical protein